MYCHYNQSFYTHDYPSPDKRTAMTQTPSPLIDLLLHKALAISEYPPGRYRSEEVISAIAAFAGECQMRRAGEVDFSTAKFTPGQAVFSARINNLLSGDQTGWASVPASSAFGSIFQILTHLSTHPWSPSLFPNPADIYSTYAAAAGTARKWGFAPLSVPQQNHPRIPPLRAAFDLRNAVYKSGPHPQPSANELAAAAVMSLIKALIKVRGSIDDTVVLTLAFETLNALAKTAPVLETHITEFAARQPGRARG
jgi:hypothetical protein